MSILQSVERFLSTGGASCKLNASSFTVDVWLFTWLLLCCCKWWFHAYKLTINILVDYCIWGSLPSNSWEWSMWRGQRCQLCSFGKIRNSTLYWSVFSSFGIFRLPFYGCVTPLQMLRHITFLLSWLFLFCYRSFSRSLEHFLWKAPCIRRATLLQVLLTHAFHFL